MSSNGARITLVAKGVQDTYLMGEPNSTYFKQVYQRHTNFAMANINQVVEGAIGAGSKSVVEFGRVADLLSYVYIYQTSDTDVDSIEHIDKVELYIGGQLIVDMDQGEMFIWDAMMAPNASKQDGGLAGSFNKCIQALHFWFCDNWGGSLPLCAMSNTTVKMHIHWKASAASYNWMCKANYIFLDHDERRKFTQAPKLEYLIQQWQRTSEITSSSTRIPIDFNHPIISLFLTGIDDTVGANLFKRVKIVANGNELFNGRLIEFCKAPYWHTSNARLALTRAMFPFCIDAGSCNPSGSCNFSRLDDVTFIFEDGVPLTGSPTYQLDNKIHAVGWNVLKIQNGMAGLAYAN